MQLLVNSSGLLAAIFAWFFVITPSFLIKFNRKKLPISHTGTVGKIKYIFNFGLVASGVSQILFILLMLSKFPNITLGATIFLFGSISVILVGLITLKRSSKIHTVFAILYFCLTAIGGLIISLQLHVWYITIFVSLEILSMSYFYYLKRNRSLCEYSGILFSTFWVLSFYLIR